jgi:hypothetical protein
MPHSRFYRNCTSAPHPPPPVLARAGVHPLRNACGSARLLLIFGAGCWGSSTGFPPPPPSARTDTAAQAPGRVSRARVCC